MAPVYAPPPHFPTVWQQLVKMMGRKNKPKARPQKDRGRTKGGSKPAKPGHKGGKGEGKKGGGLFS